MLIPNDDLRAFLNRRAEPLILFACFSILYIGLSWLVSGGERWWIVDFVNGNNIFYGDDAYRFFLARSAWQDASLFTYNFDLPAALILENAVVSLAQGNLFLSRCIHGLIAAFSLCLVWDSGRMLGIGRGIMTGAVLVMGLMPLYAFVALSFYGEFWLGTLLAIAIWLFLRNKWLALSWVVALFPLARAEGIYFWLPLFLYMVKERRWRESAIMIAPGAAYFVYICLSLDSINDFFYWRDELRAVLKKIDFDNDFWAVPGTYSVLLTIPAVMGLVFANLRKLWPFVAGAAFFVCVLAVLTHKNLTSYEPRYIFSVIPVLVIMWAAFFARILQKGFSGAMLCYAIVVLMVVASNLSSLTVLKVAVERKGFGWTLERIFRGDWEQIFPSYLPEHMDSYRSMSRKIEGMLEKDTDIDRLVMFDSFLYYFIDPKKVPDHVRVDYPAISYLTFHFMLNGQIFTQHPGGKMYSYIRFEEPSYSQGERRALYADLMPMPAYPYRWKEGPVELYLFSYRESLHPEVNLEEVPVIDPDFIKGMYEQVFDQ